MTKKVLFFLLLFVYACEKDVSLQANDASRIENATWKSLTATTPDWKYTFDKGILIQSLPAFSTVITSYTFPYAIRHDTVFIGGDATNPPRTWIVTFHCDSVAQVQELGITISTVKYLKKQ